VFWKLERQDLVREEEEEKKQNGEWERRERGKGGIQGELS